MASAILAEEVFAADAEVFPTIPCDCRDGEPCGLCGGSGWREAAPVYSAAWFADQDARMLADFGPEMGMVEAPEASEADRAAWAEMTRDEPTADDLAEADHLEEMAARAEFEDAWDEYESWSTSLANRWSDAELAECGILAKGGAR